MSDVITVIKRVEFFCPKTRTTRTRDGGTFEVTKADALKGIQDGTLRAQGYSCGVIPDGLKASPKIKSKAKEPVTDGDESPL